MLLLQQYISWSCFVLLQIKLIYYLLQLLSQKRRINPVFQTKKQGKMFVESVCLDDPNTMFSMEMDLQNELNMGMEMQVNDPNHQMSNFNGDYHTHYSTPTDHILQPAAPDSLLSLLSLPKCTPSSLFTPISLSNGVVYDPLLLPLSLPPQPQPPLLRELFGSGGYAFGGAMNGPLFGGMENEGDYIGGIGYQDCNNEVLEMSREGMVFIGKNKDGKDVKTEKDRRLLMNDKYQCLRRLIPSPTKSDRASIVGDAIIYINKLKERVAELKCLVEKKRSTGDRHKRSRTGTEDVYEGKDSNSVGDMDHDYDTSSIRSSCIHKKTQNTEVDVRIVDDEVTVKLVQQKEINCLLLASRTLHELQLDLHHVVGGLIGDHYSFLFNSKICEGSLVYASAIANKLIEVVDTHDGAISPTCSSK